MKRAFLLFFFLCVSESAFAQGGATGIAPSPNQLGTQILLNPGFETGSFTNWTTSASGGCTITVDSTVAHTGSDSAKFSGTCTNSPSLSQNFTVPSTHEALSACVWVKTSGYSGTLDLKMRDDTHGTVPAGNANYSLFPFDSSHVFLGGTSDWVQLCRVFYVDQLYHGGDNYQLQMAFNTGAGSTVWLDDFTLQSSWYPVRTYIKYPNFRGFLWSDKTPSSFYCNGAATTLAEVCGVTEIDPPTTTACATSTCKLAVKVDTSAGCPSSALGLNQTITTPSGIQHWNFSGSGLTFSPSTTYFVCTTTTWDDSTTLSYNDWKLVTWTAAVRDNSTTGFVNWFDSDGAWVHNGTRHLMFGTYDSWSAAFRDNTGLYTTKAPYENNINSLGDCVPIASSTTDTSGVKGCEVLADYHSNRFSWVMNINPFSGVEPQSALGDQLSPWLQAMADYGCATFQTATPCLTHAQILNNSFGTAVNEVFCATENASCGGVPPQPTLSASSSGGNIGANLFVFVELSVVVQRATKNDTHIDETVPTTANTCTGSGCIQVGAGSTNSVTVTLPACSTTRWLGFYVYAATNSANSVPANSSFQRQHGPSWQPCGGSLVIGTGTSGLITTGFNPLTTGTTDTPNPRLTDSQTDPQIWTAFANDMSRFNGLASGTAPVGAGAFYTMDEPNTPLGYYPALRQYATLSAQGKDIPTWGAFDITGLWGWREVMDVFGEDPYGYGGYSGASDVRALGQDNRSCTLYNGTNNATGTNANCNPSEIDFGVDLQQKAVYGTKPQVVVVQLFNADGIKGFTYPEMRRQYYKALLGCQQWGNLGCGVVSWGWVGGQGEEYFYYGANLSSMNSNTKSYFDVRQANNEIMDLEPVWLQAVSDSPRLNGGTGQVDGASGETVSSGKIVSNIKMDHTVASVCSVDGVAGSKYDTDRADFPFGPIRFLTKQMPNGDQWIVVNDMCGGTEGAHTPVTFNVTFTLVNPPASVAEIYGQDDPGYTRTYTISSNAFTAQMEDDQDVHVFVIRSPRKEQYTGQAAVTGTYSHQ